MSDKPEHETKSARIEARILPSLRARLEEASDKAGETVSDYVVGSVEARIRKPTALPGETPEEFALRLCTGYETAKNAYKLGMIEAVELWRWVSSMSEAELEIVKKNEGI